MISQRTADLALLHFPAWSIEVWCLVQWCDFECSGGGMALCSLSTNGYNSIPVLLMILYEAHSIEFVLPLNGQVLMLK